MAKVIFHLSIYVFFMCLCVRVCAVSLILTCFFSSPLHRPVSPLFFSFLFLSFPFFSSKDNSPDTQGSIYASHTSFQAFKQTPMKGCAHTHTQQRVVSILLREAFCFVERREYFLLKGLIYNCCTVLRHCPAIGFVFIVIYYIEDIFSV